MLLFFNLYIDQNARAVEGTAPRKMKKGVEINIRKRVGKNSEYGLHKKKIYG